MKFLYCFLIIVFSIFSNKIYCQQTSLSISNEFQKAYENKTRSMDGKPGEKYWQNHSDYKIAVDLDTKSRLLRGKETIIYENNSPDQLKEIVFRLYPDIFKRNFKRDGSNNISSDDLNETGVNIEKLIINNKKAVSIERRGTNMFVKLNEVLDTKSKINIEITWSYLIPKSTHIREGIYFNSSYFVAYWYPQIAVYDDIDGWDVTDYTGQQEFYNDFNNYEVDITIPASHMVWATGVWQNPDKILKPNFLDLYNKAIKSDEIVKIITENDRKKNEITISQTKNTFKFKAEHVPDFAFAASDTYLWDLTSTIVEDSTKKRTAIGSAYHPTSKDFLEVAAYGKKSVDYFSHSIPGVPFPYPNITIFNGDGGMEFPMMVNDGSFSDQEAAEVAAHEIAHTYFPFYMGINERKYAWMDEGWAQTLPNDMVINVKGKDFKPQQSNALYFQMIAGKDDTDVPLMTPSTQLNGNVYTNASYFRPSQAYTFLKNMLGDELFGKVLREYMNRWNGKHPIPYDFFNSFNNYLNEDLSWYWKPWFFETGMPDLEIKEVNTLNKETKITIINKARQPVPVYLIVTFKDGSTELINYTASVWKESNTLTIIKKYQKAVDKLQLGNSQIPDADTKNNNFKSH